MLFPLRVARGRRCSRGDVIAEHLAGARGCRREPGGVGVRDVIVAWYRGELSSTAGQLATAAPELLRGASAVLRRVTPVLRSITPVLRCVTPVLRSVTPVLWSITSILARCRKRSGRVSRRWPETTVMMYSEMHVISE